MTPLDVGRFDGPDCGVDGCAREIGHIGDHRRDPEVANLSTSDLPLDAERLVRAVIDVCNRAGWSIYRTGDGSASWVDRREAARQFGVEYDRLLPTQASDSKEKP